MKKITTLITLLILVGCNSMQTNIEVDSVDTFNLDNYSDFSIKINESSISAEINPIDLERFKDNFKTSLIESGLSYSESSDLTFEIIITTKDKIFAFGPSNERAMWPPSNCPAGIRFKAVTKNPVHPARTTGWDK